MRILVEIMREGKWRTDAWDIKRWLRQNLARRVKRSKGLEDYDRNGKRRPGDPKFDRRNGALTKCETRPFAEFEVRDEDGHSMSPDEAIDGWLAQKDSR
jgi:hypothetical protein